MKKVLTILSLIIITATQAQQNFEKHWKTVENFELEGKTTSANEIVNTIYKKAKKRNNSNQLIKALLYQSKFALVLQEEAELKIVKRLEKEIKEASFPTNAILQSVLANFKWQYFQQHRWQIYNRTKTDKPNLDDFRTWDLNTLFTSIHEDYKSSIASVNQLQNISIADYKYILIYDTDTEHLRPTLYDLLAHRALDFFKTDEARITKPKERFYVDQESYFAPSNEFTKLHITTTDTVFSKYEVLKTYQQLEQFHLERKQINALIDVYINRLLFVKNNTTLHNNNDIYTKSLEQSLQHYKTGDAYALLKAHYAHVLYDTATLENNPNNRKKALTIAENLIKTYPNSEGAVIAQNIQSRILQPVLQLQNEQTVPSNSASKIWVEFNNVKQVYLHIYQIPQNHSFYQHNYKDRPAKINEFFTTRKALKTVHAALPQKGDYFNHSTEVALPNLELGRYMILATIQKKFNKSDLFAYNAFTVSNLSALETDYHGKKIFQVLNSSSGEPIQHATVKFGKTQKSTNEYGETSFSGRRDNAEVIINYQKDSLLLGNQYHYSNYHKPKDESKTERAQAFLFLDRSIYRPGQEVYFKGIVLSKVNYKSTAVAEKKFNVIIKDANYQELKTFNLTTNKFGSFSEKFQLPKDGLTGNFTIQIIQEKKHFKHFTQAHSYFSVEEYKRPKFEVNFNPVTESFAVNENICVTGIAKALLGTNISGAKVRYNIVRKTQFNHWRYWSRHYETNEQEIAHGEVITNDKGEFDINFNALPDKTKNKKDLPVFSYEITANVTDINGETRTATTTVKVGYHTLELNIATQDIWNVDDTPELSLNTTNLNSEFSAAKVNLKIYKLVAPKSVLRTRRLPIADTPLLSKDEFKILFPNEAYINESDYKNWKKGQLVYEEAIDTENGKKTTLSAIKSWQSGKYIIIAETTDSAKNTITEEKHISIRNEKDQTLADSQLFDYQILNATTAKKDGFIRIKLLSSCKNLNVFTEAYFNSDILFKEKVTVVGTKTFRIPLTKIIKQKPLHPNASLRIQFAMVKHQDYKIITTTVDLSVAKESLLITTQTFRDKLQPGAKEKWSFTIKNNSNKSVQTEVLASMYDASLDQFKPHNWPSNIGGRDYYRNDIPNKNCNGFRSNHFTIKNPIYLHSKSYSKVYTTLNPFGLQLNNIHHALKGKVAGITIAQEEVLEENVMIRGYNSNREDVDVEQDDDLKEGEKQNSKTPNFKTIVARKNLNETAFFYPQLKTDTNGNLTFEFESPEALTRWKLQLFGHTQAGVSGKLQKEVVTQKELMVVPNPPRFLRENDTLVFQTKISSLSDKLLNGQAKLELYNAVTGAVIDTELSNNTPIQNFKLQPNGNTSISWQLIVPEEIPAVEYKVLAMADNFTDGETNVLPVLTNKMLVTESIPLTVRANSTKKYHFNKLQNNNSTTLRNHQLTLEYTTNPAWYAVQSLPYLMEFPHECAEQTFARYYANTLGGHIINSNPKIKHVFESWKANGKLVSKLEQNEELKQILIAETPWLRDAQSESEKKKQLAILFDLERLASEQKNTIKKLQKMQLSSGGFPWFKGGNANEFITRHIVAGFGHLNNLGVTKNSDSQQQIITKAVRYIDAQFIDRHFKKLKHQTAESITVDSHDLHYLYARSFFKNSVSFDKKVKPIVNTYINKAKKDWIKRGLLQKTMLALVLHRFNDRQLPQLILEHLKETAIVNEDKGMYWKANTAGWYWNEAPIETQALVIEAFSEITEDQNTIEELKIWLLNNKRKNSWDTTKSTTEATYALLLQGENWLAINGSAVLQVGNEKINTKKLAETSIEAGSGYFKTTWNANQISNTKANIQVKNTSNVTQFGGYYWQYFEQLDKITNEEHKSDIQLSKKLFLKEYTDAGEQLKAIDKSTTLKVGSLVKVRIELHVNDNFEFVHLKDMRASTFEPVDVLSGYKWQDGLGYYQSTKDVATHFFFDYLPKGTYVLEYDVRVNNSGNFSNGISSIQSMYAPEFSSHSKGVRVSVKK